MKFKKNVTRPCSLTDIEIWHKGESNALKQVLGFGFYNTIYSNSKGMVTLYYETEELAAFEEILEEKLTEELFDTLCDEYFEIIEESKLAEDEDIIEILVRCWPALTIFDVVSKYPEYATPSMLRRLIRIRTETERLHYELSKRIEHEQIPNDYIFYKGNVYEMGLTAFLEEKGFVATGNIM